MLKLGRFLSTIFFLYFQAAVFQNTHEVFTTSLTLFVREMRNRLRIASTVHIDTQCKPKLSFFYYCIISNIKYFYMVY